MNDKLGRFEIGHWYTTDIDNDAIKCVVINDIKSTLGKLANKIRLDKFIIKNSEFVNKGDPILVLRFSEYYTGEITAFKSGIVKHLKHVGENIKAGEILCKIYPSWECPYCSSKFDSKIKEYNHETKCRDVQMQKFNNYIPIFDSIDYRVDPLTKKKEINSFYSFFYAEIKKNNYIDIKNQIDYLYIYAEDIIKLDEELRIEEFKNISEHYKQYTKFTYHCKRWISDTYLLLNNYEKALEYYPRKEIGKSGSERINTILNIKLKLNKYISGYEILTLIGPQTTIWAKDHLSEIEKIIDKKLEYYDQKKPDDNLLLKWSKTSNTYIYGIYTMTGCYRKIDFVCHAYSSNPETIEFIRKISVEAENGVREKYNIPKIGEGWISETELYYKIKEHFKSSVVIHGGKPKWLGKQHLDIYFPEYNIGIEYQGSQHYESVDFFGGEEGFEKIKKLDEKKRIKCIKNNCTLIYVYEGYDINNIISQISNEIEKQL